MESIAIQGTKRTDLGKKSTKQARRTGQIPCVIYGGAQNIHFTTGKMGVRDLIYSPDFKTVDVALGDQAVKCVLKDVVFHPVTDEIVHMDFMEMVADRKLKLQVPIRFTGVAPGVKTGGKLVQKLRKAKIKCNAADIVDSLYVDISELELGSSVRVSDIQSVNGVQVMNAPGIPIASVEIPRALKSADASDDATAEDATAEGAEAAAAE